MAERNGRGRIIHPATASAWAAVGADACLRELCVRLDHARRAAGPGGAVLTRVDTLPSRQLYSTHDAVRPINSGYMVVAVEAQQVVGWYWYFDVAAVNAPPGSHLVTPAWLAVRKKLKVVTVGKRAPQLAAV